MKHVWAVFCYRRLESLCATRRRAYRRANELAREWVRERVRFGAPRGSYKVKSVRRGYSVKKIPVLPSGQHSLAENQK